MIPNQAMQLQIERDIHHQLKARLLALPPRAFELFAGDLLEFIGLQRVSVTRYSGDGGIDAVGSLETSTALVSVPIGVQVKRYRNNVQRADIDRFIGALSGQYSQGMFITTAGYARQAALKAATGFPRIATIDGDQITTLMVQHHLGVIEEDGALNRLDEEYFGQFELQSTTSTYRIGEQSEAYTVGASDAVVVRPENDLISLRALSHALRVDTSVIRRWIEKGHLHPVPSRSAAQTGVFFRRDQIEPLRAKLLGVNRPTNPNEWRQEFLDFARSRNLSKSYKPVMLKALLKLVNRRGEADIDALTKAFRAFYVARRQAGLLVEFGPPDLSDSMTVNDSQLRQLIVRHPLERFLIKGFLEYLPTAGIIRFAPYLWADLRFWELLDVQQSADQQLEYYYARSP